MMLLRLLMLKANLKGSYRCLVGGDALLLACVSELVLEQNLTHLCK